MTERVLSQHITGGLAAVGVLLISGCASVASQEIAAPTPESNDASESLTEMLDPCATLNLTTVEPGAITFATTVVPAPPLFLTDEPSDREGIGAELAYSLAAVLGFGPGQVTWEFVPTNQILSGEFVEYDLALGAFVPADDESAPVVYSQPYAVVESTTVQEPDGGESPESESTLVAASESVDLSFVLVRGNPLLACVDRALIEMSELGTLEDLRERWLGQRR